MNSDEAVSDSGPTIIKMEGNPTILVADDEELMREVVTIMIEENGGNAICAVDGSDAVRIFKEQADEIDLVFMDFSMPGLNGYEAYLEIAKIKPEIKVLMVSGLKITAEVEELRRQEKVEFLSKPFFEVELVKAFSRLQGS